MKEPRTVNIGGISLGRVWLAPMAGYTDIAFRELARECGAALTVTEMVSVRGLVRGNAATAVLTRLSPEEKPSCIQLFGNCPAEFAAAAQKLDCDIIDINMGCPMPKIVKNGDGAALLRTPELAGEIVRAIKQVTDRPVTVKTRLGYTAGDGGAQKLIECVTQAGADAVIVHGRYAEQKYAGRCDFAALARLKAACPVPLIASGDITRDNLCESLSLFDGVMIGRGALSDIGIFSGTIVPPEEVARRHIKLLQKYFDERYTVDRVRKFFVHYFRSVRGGKALKNAVNTSSTVREALSALDAFCAQSHLSENGY